MVSTLKEEDDKRMRATAVSALFMAFLMVVLVGMPSATRAQESAQDTLIVGVQNDTPNLHPWDTATNSVWKAFLWRQWVYEGLYNLNPDGSQIFPVLATGYTKDTPDGLNVTVTIRQGVRFTDGQPLNATDVVFSYQILGFNSQLSDTILKSIMWPDPIWPRWNASMTTWGAANPSHVGIEATGEYTVKFHLRQAYSMFYFGTLGSQVPIMPSHIWKDHLVPVDISPFILPDGTSLNPGIEHDLDRDFGSRETDVAATIGTGPWYLVQWTRLTSATLQIYEGYWGKNNPDAQVDYLGITYPFFPSTLKKMEFRIYGILDVAVLALKSGEVHVVPWHLGTGFYNDLSKDPRMGFQISASDGFFYIAFNMRKEPFDDLNFRKAVSYAIDKDFIVDRLLGGFGIKGESPISPINPGYINSSATTPTFDIAQANSMLDAAGYIDADSDGWRDFPDGRPMKFNILTPAKDYDPIRADAGIMIANNLKAVKLNIDSAPTAFDAIVSAVFVAVQFDMYILGWVNLGPFPELYLAEFFHCQSLVELGIGSNTPGICNPQLDAKLDILDVEMDDAKRIQAAKDAQGILTSQLPYNTLYITRWIEGYRQDIWGGWVQVNGEIFNAYSIGILGLPGEIQPPTGPLTVSLNGPGQALAGKDAHLHVYAVQAGVPADGVNVTITATTGEVVNVMTDSQGFADAVFNIPYAVGTLDFIASAQKGTESGGDILSINVILPYDISQLNITTPTPTVAPGGTATITAKVTDKAGNAIANVPLEVFPELVVGTVSPSNATTDSTGIATFTYTAPATTLIPNKNQYDYIKMRATDPIRPQLPETREQTFVMGVQNPTSDWYVVGIDSVSAYVVDTDGVSAIPLTSDVTVSVKKQDGTAVAGEDITVTMSDSDAINVDSFVKATGAGGTATFTFTANTSVSTAVAIDFSVQRAFFAMSGLSMLVTDGTTPANASMMQLTSKYIDPNGIVDMTVTVYDNTGTPEVGAEVNIFVPYNEVGNPIAISGTDWSFYDYLGSVFFNTTDVSGQVTTSFNMKSFPSDNIVSIETGIYGFGPRGAFIFGSPADTYINQAVIQKRNKIATVSSFEMTPRWLLRPGANSTNLKITFMDVAGAAAGMDVAVYRGKGNLAAAPKIGEYTTDANGMVTVPWTEPEQSLDTPIVFTTAIIDTSYALGGQVGSIPFEQNLGELMPDPDVLIPTGSPASTIVRAGMPQTYNIKVTNFYGVIVQDALVIGTIGESSGNVTTRTDGTGNATISLTPGTFNPTTTQVWEAVFTIKGSGGKMTTIQLGTFVGVGVFGYSNLQIPSSATVGERSTISVTVSNSGPVNDYALVTLNMDGTAYASQYVMVSAGGSVTVDFIYTPSDTDAHTFTIAQQTSLTGSLTAGAAGGADMVLVAGVGIVLLIVGLLIGLLMGKMMKPKGPPEEEIEKPMEPVEEPMVEEPPKIEEAPKTEETPPEEKT